MITERRSSTWTPGLSQGERETLFAIAMDSLVYAVGAMHAAFDYAGYVLTPSLQTDRATFVTLHKASQLRGCIGSLTPDWPLCRSVHRHAVAAALEDPRFPAVREEELPGLSVDVSVLSPIVPIADVTAFRLGEHGIILEKGMQRAVYLPEVATEQGWTVEQTLGSLCQKAGLPTEAWREGAILRVFSSVVLSME